MSSLLLDHVSGKTVGHFGEALKKAYAESGPTQLSFNPYAQSGGTIAAIAGDNFVFIGGDTRLSHADYCVLTRSSPKVFQLTGTIYLAATGFHGDVLQLIRVLRTRVKQYLFTYGKHMDVHAAAQLLSRTLYYKRFFPYYAGVLLGGLDAAGKAAVYSYDPVGTIEMLPYSSQGEASYLIEPFLDNQIDWKHLPPATKNPLTYERAKQLFHDAFVAATEREKSTGDSLHVVAISAGSCPVEYTVQLRHD
uniref:Proteasome subunit beta n=1 Tax=Trichuris muris TaxID=70415 RepID=A0A5S6QZX4_TRIMR